MAVAPPAGRLNRVRKLVLGVCTPEQSVGPGGIVARSIAMANPTMPVSRTGPRLVIHVHALPLGPSFRPALPIPHPIGHASRARRRDA
jgi:hypothetical protein